MTRSVAPFVALLALLLSLLACSAGELIARPMPTPPPTRVAAPTFTPTPDSVQALVVVTPPNRGTPGVIIVPPGVDPSSLIPLPATPTSPSTETPTVTPTPLPPASAPDTPTAVVVVPVVETPGASSPQATPVSQSGTPQPAATPAVGMLVPLPTATAVPEPTATPTFTPVPPPTATPTTTPTPFVLVSTGLVNLRSGPGTDYPLVAQLGPNIPVAIVGRNPEGTWYQICCVNGGSVWVAKGHVEAVNDTAAVALVLAEAAPTASPTGTPTATPTVTSTPTATPYPFQVAEGPLYFPTNNEMLTVWAKIFADAGGTQVPLPGYFVRAEFRNRADNSTFDPRPNTKGEQPSKDTFEYNMPPGPGSGNRVQFNYKFEFLPPDPKADDPQTTNTRATVIDGFWRIYVVDGSGTQLSAPILFDTLSGNLNREVYVAWVLTR